MVNLARVFAWLAYVGLLRHASGRDSEGIEGEQSSSASQALASLLYAMSPVARNHRAYFTKPTVRASRRVSAHPNMEDPDPETGKWLDPELKPTQVYYVDTSGKKVYQNITGAKDIIDEGRIEKDIINEKKIGEQAKQARSEEAISAQRALGESAVDALRGDADVLAALEGGRREPSYLSMTIKDELKSKVKGNLAYIGESIFFDSISYGGNDLNDPTYLSEQFRDGKAKAVIVPVDYEFSLGSDALKKTVKEQATRKGDFPGPLPVIARAPLIDPLQLAKAAIDGADAAIISVSIAGEEKTRELMTVAEKLGLATLLRVTSAEQLTFVLELGAKMVLFGDMTFTEATELKDTMPKDVVSIADFPYEDVRGAWLIRDAGFDALVSGISLNRLVIRDRVPPASAAKAMTVKGSTKFGTGWGKGRGEGAKENLGQLAM